MFKFLNNSTLKSILRLVFVVGLVSIVSSCTNLRLEKMKAGSSSHSTYLSAKHFSSNHSTNSKSSSASRNTTSSSRTTGGPTLDQTNQLNRFITSIHLNLDRIWGSKQLLFGPSDLVKYSDNYNTRAIINLAAGFVTFQSVNPNYQRALRNEIIYTLLMPEQPKDGLLYDDKIPRNNGTTFLANQIVDNNKKPILTYSQANKYADFLLKYRVHSAKLSTGRIVHYIILRMTPNHLQTRAKIYAPLVYKYASQFHVDPYLIFAIMKTESAFNPYAKSGTGAIGLMQIIPSTAGADAFKYLGINGRPSRDYLFNPANNIKLANAYLALMKRDYFSGIKNPTSLRYLMTASYNAGPGGTLKVFAKDRKLAIQRINNMTPKQIYDFIIRHHYSYEARRYIYKVSQSYRLYR